MLRRLHEDIKTDRNGTILNDGNVRIDKNETGGNVRIDENEKKTKEVIHAVPGCLTPDEYWKQCFSQKRERTFYEVAWNKLYRRTLFDHTEFQVGKLHEDALIMYDLVTSCRRLAITDKVGYCYLQRSDSIMGVSKQSLKNLSGPEAHVLRAESFAGEKKYWFAVRSLEIAVNFMLLSTYGEGGKQSREYKRLKHQAWQTFRRLSPHIPVRKKTRLLLFFICEPAAQFVNKRKQKAK